MELGWKGLGSGQGRIGSVTARSCVLIFTLFFTVSGYSQNLVANGNFSLEGGSFDDWTISHQGGGTDYPYFSPTIYEGGYDDPAGDPYYARFLFEENGSEDILSQDIATIPGDIYEVSFNAEDGAGHNFETQFSFGNFTYDLNNIFAIGPGEWYYGWTNLNFTLTASQAETDLSFLAYADTGSEFGVTGVSVTQVPVPDFDGVKVGNTFQVSVANPTNYSIIIQASTNLVNWVDVCTNSAPYTFTDSCTAYPNRFYRAALVVSPNGPP